jgi:hypothetical protein
MQSTPSYAVIIIATPNRVKVRRVLRRSPTSTVLWACTVPSLADGQAVAGREAVAGRGLIRITRSLSSLSALIEMRARVLNIEIRPYNVLDDDD